MQNCGVYLDKNVSINSCISPDRQAVRDFFEYLRLNPGLGIVTQDDFNSTRKKLGKIVSGRPNSMEIINRYDCMEAFLKLDNIPHTQLQDVQEIKDSFDNIVAKRKMEMGYPISISEPFQEIFIKLHFPYNDSERSQTRKLFCESIEYEDAIVISKVKHLKKDYYNMFLASFDNHIRSQMSKEMLKGMGIISGAPNEILPQIKGCQTYIQHST